MILRKPAAVFCPGSSVFSFFPSTSVPITSPCRPSCRASSCEQVRGYASVPDVQPDDTKHGSGKPHWPVSLNPTPYEIFDHAKGDPYNKARFYQLVKMYHPDRHLHTAHDGIPHPTKLERYRLIVAANDILSDPEKRRLYDRYGAGWGGQSDLQSSVREADRAWRRRPGNASMNATWEDWERWYQERDGKKQEPVFMSNGGFVALIALFAILGGWGHITRAGNRSADLLDMRDQRHSSISKAMRHRQSLNAGLSKEDRVQHFLKQREGWGYDLASHEHPPGEVKVHKSSG